MIELKKIHQKSDDLNVWLDNSFPGMKVHLGDNTILASCPKCGGLFEMEKKDQLTIDCGVCGLSEVTLIGN